MSNVIRYNISADVDFDKELREIVKHRSISAFFVEAARKELRRIHRKQAMQLVSGMSDPFPQIEDPAEYIHTLRRKETEHRTHKLNV
jgi:hypothetical protein